MQKTVADEVLVARGDCVLNTAAIGDRAIASTRDFAGIIETDNDWNRQIP